MRRYDPEHSEELLDPMRFYVEAAEVYAAVDAGKHLDTGQVRIELHTEFLLIDSCKAVKSMIVWA